MFWQKKEPLEKAEQKINQINEVVRKSFVNVKRDTSNIFQWMNFFYRKGMEHDKRLEEQERVIIEQDKRLDELEREISYMPKTREEIRKIVDDYYSFETLTGRVRDLTLKVEDLSHKQNVIERGMQKEQIVQKAVQQPSVETPRIDDIQERLEKLEQKKVAMKEKIIKRLTRNSKDYIKGVIVSYIKKYDRISALQLKDIIVDEQNLCSKSSFYRLLEELEQIEEIGVIKQGREKHYMHRPFAQV